MYRIKFAIKNLIFLSDISNNGIFSLTTQKITNTEKDTTILNTYGKANSTISRLQDRLLKILSDYLYNGKNPDQIELDLSGFKTDEIKIYKSLIKVPYGNIVSYSSLALHVLEKQANRYVGNVLSRNRLQILIPCHRVINKNYKIGGFTSIHGLKLKYFLLNKEGIILDGDKIKHPRFYQFENTNIY